MKGLWKQLLKQDNDTEDHLLMFIKEIDNVDDAAQYVYTMLQKTLRKSLNNDIVAMVPGTSIQSRWLQHMTHYFQFNEHVCTSCDDEIGLLDTKIDNMYIERIYGFGKILLVQYSSKAVTIPELTQWGRRVTLKMINKY